jgi:hypothetical protein
MGKMQKRKKRNTQQYTTVHRSAMKKQGINTGAARSTGEGDSAPFRARAVACLVLARREISVGPARWQPGTVSMWELNVQASHLTNCSLRKVRWMYVFTHYLSPKLEAGCFDRSTFKNSLHPCSHSQLYRCFLLSIPIFHRVLDIPYPFAC